MNLEYEPKPTHEQMVRKIVGDIGIPVLRRLHQKYGNELGWELCGSWSVLATRVINASTGIPLLRDQNPLTERLTPLTFLHDTGANEELLDHEAPFYFLLQWIR